LAPAEVKDVDDVLREEPLKTAADPRGQGPAAAVVCA
jgi:hypothetical protein